MNQHSLQSLLQRGIKTWHNSSAESMINLVLVSEELALNVIKCMLHNINHGSDYEAIKTTFDVAVPEQVSEKRLLFKNASWNKIRDMISARLVTSSTKGDIQEQTDLLTVESIDIETTNYSKTTRIWPHNMLL